MSQVRPFTHLVVVGSSSATDALQSLLAALPSDFPVPIVVGQHLHTGQGSELERLLAVESPLQIRLVRDHEALEAGVAYIIPPDHGVEIGETEITVVPGDGHPSPSIDSVFTSAAEAFGEHLLAVLLAADDASDGAAGARAVKRAGGIVVAESSSITGHAGLPISLPPTLVDVVAPPTRIAQIVMELLSGFGLTQEPDETQVLRTLLQTVQDRSGIDFRRYKLPTILHRLQRRMVATDSDDIRTYSAYLEGHPEEYQLLINAFLINVTEFFRDRELFEYLAREVIPGLISYARQHNRELRIWSAGCATGEEAYSLAILVAEALGPELDFFNVRIFATDLDAEAVDFARRGIYPADALKDVEPELVTRYFTREDGNYQVRKRIRNLTVFGQHDLAKRAPFPRIDMVLCRNVLIYFTPELQRHALRVFAYSLRDNGYLVLGKAETARPLDEFFTLGEKDYKVYRRHGARFLLPNTVLNTAVTAQHSARPAPLGRGRALASPQSVDEGPAASSKELLFNLPVGIIVINRRYDILTINSAARRLLAIHGAAVGEDLLHLSQEVPYTELRGAIDTALREHVPAQTQPFPIEDLATGLNRYLQISCHPQQADGTPDSVDTVLVVVSDVTNLAQSRLNSDAELAAVSSELEKGRSEAALNSQRRDEIIERLMSANRELMEANQELSAINEELRATSEEFQISAEEAQAATEEVETLNEELQATNEELETLNEELEATVEELNTTNDELQARSLEMEQLARVSEEERARIETVLASMSDAVLMVSPEGRVLLTNEAYNQCFGPDVILRDADGNPLPPAETPQARAGRGETFQIEFMVRKDDGTTRWYEASGRPIPAIVGQPQGDVVVIRDITYRSIQRLQDEFLALASHELRGPLTPLRSYLQLLQRRFSTEPGDERPRLYVERALHQQEQLARLIDDLTDVTRLQTGEFRLERTPLALDDLVAGAIETARAIDSDTEIRYEAPSEQLVVTGDEGRLEQVLLNLLANSIRHGSSSRGIDVRLRRCDGAACIDVQDYGEGIPADQLGRIFSRYYRGQQSGGMGLGLYIAKQIMTAHGGSIDVESVPSKGTRFTLCLPLEQEAHSVRNTSHDAV